MTVQQQVTRNMTITYVSNVGSTQEQVIQVEYNVNRNVSIVALRDYNGTFGIDIKIKKAFPVEVACIGRARSAGRSPAPPACSTALLLCSSRKLFPLIVRIRNKFRIVRPQIFHHFLRRFLPQLKAGHLRFARHFRQDFEHALPKWRLIVRQEAVSNLHWKGACRKWGLLFR